MIGKTAIAVIIGVVVIAGVIGFQINETMWKKTSTDEYYDKNCEKGCEGVAHVVYPDDPQVLYGLQINKGKYLLGESVYIIVKDIPPNVKSTALFFTPTGKQFYEVVIDGSKSSGFKQYFKPQLLANRSLCDVNELIGKWTITFAEAPTERMYFEVLSEYLPGSEGWFKEETCGKAIELNPELIQQHLKPEG